MVEIPFDPVSQTFVSQTGGHFANAGRHSSHLFHWRHWTYGIPYIRYRLLTIYIYIYHHG